MRYTLAEYERAVAILRDGANATRRPTSYERKQLNALRLAYLTRVDDGGIAATNVRRLLAALDPAAAAHRPLSD
jgi:hypothetical protein